MYNWRITSFLAFTSAFYCVALISTGLAWGAVTILSSPSTITKEEEQKKIKKEENADLDAKATNGHATRPIKNEPDDEDLSGEESALSLSNLSDNATTFPTLGRQMPIRYPIQPASQSGYASASGSRSGTIKREDSNNDQAARIEAMSVVEPLAAMTAGELAEDEDDELDRGRDRDRDSGIGTSMEESAREAAGLQRRRVGRGGSSGSGQKQ
jgi:seipin